QSVGQVGALSDVAARQVDLTHCAFGVNCDSTASPGYSRNDLSKPRPVWPALELLAAIGMQRFFPPRCSVSGRVGSTRGFTGERLRAIFTYYCWRQALPIMLARIAAYGALPQIDAIAYCAERTQEGSAPPKIGPAMKLK